MPRFQIIRNHTKVLGYSFDVRPILNNNSTRRAGTTRAALPWRAGTAISTNGTSPAHCHNNFGNFALFSKALPDDDYLDEEYVDLDWSAQVTTTQKPKLLKRQKRPDDFDEEVEDEADGGSGSFDSWDDEDDFPQIMGSGDLGNTKRGFFS